MTVMTSIGRTYISGDYKSKKKKKKKRKRNPREMRKGESKQTEMKEDYLDDKTGAESNQREHQAACGSGVVTRGE